MSWLLSRQDLDDQPVHDRNLDLRCSDRVRVDYPAADHRSSG